MNNFLIFHSLACFLQHTYGFIEMHRYRKFWEIFSYTLFYYRPYRGFLIRWLKPWQLSSFFIFIDTVWI
jgi:hypothetical protein